MNLIDDNTCPRCGGGIPNNAQRGQYPGALSRYMGHGPIYVCSDCGTDEAMIQYMAHLAGADPQYAVRPAARPWVKQPA